MARPAPCPLRCCVAPRRVVGVSLLYATTAVALLAFVFAATPYTGWMRVGWNDELQVFGVRIDGPMPYALLIFFACAVNVVGAIYHDLGWKPLEYCIYDPHVHTIDMFTRRTLWALATMNTLSGSLCNMFDVVLFTAQFDFALVAALSGCVVFAINVGKLTGEKRYVPYGTRRDDADAHDAVALVSVPVQPGTAEAV